MTSLVAPVDEEAKLLLLGMKKYEILYIIPSPFTEAEAPAIQKNINKIIEESGAKIINENNLGNKKLAYTIKTIKRGFYILTTFEGDRESLIKMEQKLKLTPEVLRFQITEAVKYKMPDTKRAPRKERPASAGLSSLGGPTSPSLGEPPVSNKKDDAETEINPEEDLKTIDDKIDELLKL